MAILTPEIKEFIKNTRLCVAATADKNGMPNASFKGSLQVLDDDTLIFADIFSEKTRKNLQENKKICIVMSDPTTKAGYQFKGEAELINSGELYENVCQAIAALKMFPQPKNVVKIHVAEIFPTSVTKK